MSRRRGNYNDDGDRRSRKRRHDSDYEPDEENRVEHLIVRLGEKSSSSLESILDDVSKVLENEMSTSKSKIIRIISDCVVDLPERLCTYSTLVGLLCSRNYNFGVEIVEYLVKNFKEHLKSCAFEKARVMVRFFGDLVNCHVISSASLMNFFESLIDVTMEDNIPQARSDFFVYSVLTALPYVGRELHEKKEQELEQLLNTIDNYVGKRQKNHQTGLRVWYSDTPHPQEEYIDCIWAQISKLRSDKWQERHIYRPYVAFDGILCEALQHNLPQMPPPPHDSSYIYPYPKIVFRLFDYTDCPEGAVLPGAHSIERYLIEEQIRWIIDQHHIDRKDCAAALLSLPDRHKIPLEYVVIEVILSELFALPTMKYHELLYGSLLLDLCKLQPSTLPQVLAQSVELLFERLDTMNAACIDRFTSWFAYHLSNFQFRWSWDDWKSCVKLDPLHPKPKFVRETLIRCMRLSYRQRIVELVPESFQPLLPEEPAPVNKYTDEANASLPGYEMAKTLSTKLKDKLSREEILELLKEIPNVSSDMEDIAETNYNPLQIDVFVTVLLNLASKSFTHLFNALFKNQKILEGLKTCEEAELCLLKVVYEVWSKHQQLIVVLTEKLLKVDIIQGSSVAKWVFSKEMAQDFTKSYVWEILHATIRRKIKMVQKCKEDLEKQREEYNKMDSSDADADKKEVKEEITEEIPDEKNIFEQLEKMEEKFESAQSDQKNLFLIVFQHFIMILSEHIQTCEMDGKSFKNHWFRWTIGRLQQVFFEYHEHVFQYVPTFESLLFTQDLDPHILSIFKQFCSLRS